MKIRCSSLLFIFVALLITVDCAHNKTIEGFNAVEWSEIGRQANTDNRLNEALDAYNKAIELNPEDAEAYHNRGRTYHKLANYNQALNDYKMAARLGNKVSQDFLRGQGIDW